MYLIFIPSWLRSIHINNIFIGRLTTSLMKEDIVGPLKTDSESIFVIDDVNIQRAFRLNLIPSQIETKTQKKKKDITFS